MTEAEWLTCADPAPMLEFLRDKASDRKLRLFAIACHRHASFVLSGEEAVDRVLETVEQYVEGKVTLEELQDIFDPGDLPPTGGSCRLAYPPPFPIDITAQLAREAAADTAARATTYHAALQAKNAARAVESDFLRDIFGNPFRPLPPRPEAIAPLAEQIYVGAWDKMPLLGEWLQEHGYWSEGEHCLDPNIKHVKGCWVVDWVTGRE